MFKKWVMMLPNLFIFAISLCLIGLIAIPIQRYFSAPKENIHAVLLSEKNQKVPSLEWLLKHSKVSYSQTLLQDASAAPNLIILKDSRQMTESFLSTLQHNVLIAEMLAGSDYISTYGSEKLNYLYGISYSGFHGKTYRDLGDTLSIPKKTIALFESTSGSKWSFSGEGIVLSSNTSVLVLEKGVDYYGSLTFKEPNFSANFSGNFEVLHSNEKSLSNFVLSPTKAGKDKLNQVGLSSTFPAVIRTKSLLFSGYYFAGDFSNTKMTMPYYMKGVEKYLAHRGLYERDTNEKVFWKWYSAEFKKIINETIHFQENYVKQLHASTKNALFTVENKKIKRSLGKEPAKDYFINGVNLGPALPGKTFTEFPTDTGTYAAWLRQMSNSGINTVRLYTLLPPEFYKALYEFNTTHEKPIYLLQEIWPEENPSESNYLSEQYNKIYKQEIEYGVNAIHGNANIPKRSFRAYGAYSFDVSPYLIGYLVGREMEPSEVIATNTLNAGYQYQGKFFYSESNASPTESWLAASCDYALEVEERNYQGKPLVAIVNWPTLDPLNHPSEWNRKGLKNLQYNDKVTVDINHIGVNASEISGFFGAYHIYPNYPDFMNNDTAYNAYLDSEGRFRYGGYLKDFMSTQEKYPAIVAEYGLSTSMNTAHFSPDGYNHGGLSETAQAYGLIRMNKAILREGYSGAIVFEWIDEWAKKTWITENYMIPYDQHPMWHNLLDPEQNYGLLSVKSNVPTLQKLYENSMNTLKKVEGGQNSSSLQLKLTFNAFDAKSTPVRILFSTHDGPGEKRTWEYLLNLTTSPTLLVNPGYNWIKGHYHSLDVPESTFEKMIQLTNPSGIMKNGKKYASRSQNLSILTVGKFDANTTHVEYNGNIVSIKLPYGLLGISNPANAQVLEDLNVFIPTERDKIGTTTTDRLSMKIILSDNTSLECELPLTGWKEPAYEINEKQGLKILADYFKTMEK